MRSKARRNQLVHGTKTKPDMLKKWWAARVHCVSSNQKQNFFSENCLL